MFAQQMSFYARQLGFKAMGTASSLRCLEWVVTEFDQKKIIDPCIVDIDWKKLCERMPRRQAMWERLEKQIQHRTEVTSLVQKAALARLAAVRSEREAMEEVTGVVCETLGLESVEEDRPLAEAGMDSLLAVELRNALQREARVALPATVAYDHPTVRALAAHLRRLEARSAAGGGEAEDRKSDVEGKSVDLGGRSIIK